MRARVAHPFRVIKRQFGYRRRATGLDEERRAVKSVADEPGGNLATMHTRPVGLCQVWRTTEMAGCAARATHVR